MDESKADGVTLSEKQVEALTHDLLNFQFAKARLVAMKDQALAAIRLAKRVEELESKLTGDIATNDSPPWRCFHCGEFFTNKEEAAIHFGPDREFDEPGCVARLTTSEKDLRRQVVESYQECSKAQDEVAEAENDRRLLADMQRELAQRFDGATTVWLAADRYNNARFALAQAERELAAFKRPCEDVDAQVFYVQLSSAGQAVHADAARKLAAQLRAAQEELNASHQRYRVLGENVSVWQRECTKLQEELGIAREARDFNESQYEHVKTELARYRDAKMPEEPKIVCVGGKGFIETTDYDALRAFAARMQVELDKAIKNYERACCAEGKS